MKNKYNYNYNIKLLINNNRFYNLLIIWKKFNKIIDKNNKNLFYKNISLLILIFYYIKIIIYILKKNI